MAWSPEATAPSLVYPSAQLPFPPAVSGSPKVSSWAPQKVRSRQAQMRKGEAQAASLGKIAVEGSRSMRRDSAARPGRKHRPKPEAVPENEFASRPSDLPQDFVGADLSPSGRGTSRGTKRSESGEL